MEQNNLTIKSTTIDHEARRKLDISCGEYAAVDSIFKLSRNPNNAFGGWCGAFNETLSSMLGMTNRGLIKLLKRLTEKGLIEKHATRSWYRTTQLWYDTIIVRTGEQSSLEVNKVPKLGEQSSLEKSVPLRTPYNVLDITLLRKDDTTPKRGMSCPLKNLSNPLSKKYPNGHTECVEYVTSFKFVNPAKQFRFLHQLLRSGVDFPQIDNLIRKIQAKPYFKENGYDFATVASEADRRAQINA